MSTLFKTFALLSGAALCSLSTLTAVTTDPVGYVTLSGEAGGHILNLPLLKSPIFTGIVSEVSGVDVTFTSDLPIIDKPSYIQVLSSSSGGAGSVVDLDFVEGNVLTLTQALPVSVGDQVVIREHYLIEEFGDAFSHGTSITVYNSDGTPTTASYRDNFLGQGWTGASDTPIYPGEGFVLNTPSGFSTVITGAVSVDTVVFSAAAGVTNLIGSINPGEADPEAIFASLPASSSISVYEQGGDLSSPIIYSKRPDFAGGGWSPSLSNIDFGSTVSIVLVPSSDVPVSIPAVAVGQ